MSSSSIEKSCSVHLHAEISLLKKALSEKQSDLANLRARVKNYEEATYEDHDRLIAWQDKFERLYESHKKVQKINQSLEDKLLKLVDRNSGEKAKLSSDCALLNIRLSQANYNISCLQREIERYKQDINLAIKLLHCKPDSFLPQKVSSLPLEIQSKMSNYIKKEADCENGNIGLTKGKYQILPTNDDESGQFISSSSLLHFDHKKNGDLKVAPVVVAKYLENEQRSKNFKHCETCLCAVKNLIEVEGIKFNVGTQTEDFQCTSCKHISTFESSPNFIKSSDSVISETKSSVSDFSDKMLKISKTDPLKVNPIIGHHRLCQEHKKNVQLFPSNEVLNQTNEVADNETPNKVFDKDLNQKLQSPGNQSGRSFWSQPSSKDGVKVFEDFNRNLIRTIQLENSRKFIPRICALKIQNGSNNVILGDSHYVRRPKLLDDEFLDGEKNICGNIPINFESSQSSVVLSSSGINNQADEIFSTNKTDSEKFNEIQGKDVKISNLIASNNTTFSSSKNFEQSEELKDNENQDSLGLVSIRHNQMKHSEKYSRVAEWVAKTNNIPLPNCIHQKSRDKESNLIEQTTDENIFGETCYSLESAQNCIAEKMNAEQNCSSIKSEDLAQMEYNVKKFLLKQNEWAINSDKIDHAESEEDIFIRSTFHRTETNL